MTECQPQGKNCALRSR